MGLYRKKPVVIQAKELQDSEESVNEIIEWSGGAIKKGVLNSLVITTLEGDMNAVPGDFIILGVEGEFYPCKPSIFNKTYEKAEE